MVILVKIKIIFLKGILLSLDLCYHHYVNLEIAMFVNKKLKLFPPNTCPYCLRNVEREIGRCICGNEIDETQYEKFFYTDNEYLDILKIKKKSLLSLSALLEKKNSRMKDLGVQIERLNKKENDTRYYINELTQDITSEYNSAYIRQLDNHELEMKSKIEKLNSAKEPAEKRDRIVNQVNELRIEVETLKTKVDHALSLAQQDILGRKKNFSSIYQTLMQSADEKCYSAFIGEDYMPNINFGDYRERSALVPKRLMYFLSMLIESLKEEVNFPRFLMIDTPNKEGIDKENLIKNLSLLSECDVYAKDNHLTYQIILTTGIMITC